MKLNLNLEQNAHKEILERVKSLSLAHELVIGKQEEPVLVDSGVDYVGEKAIADYLDQLAGELHNWYYCNC